MGTATHIPLAVGGNSDSRQEQRAIVMARGFLSVKRVYNDQSMERIATTIANPDRIPSAIEVP